MDLSVDLEDFLKLVDQKKEVFLIDFSWVYYKSYYAFGNLSVPLESYSVKNEINRETDYQVDNDTEVVTKEKRTGHIFGLLQTLVSMKRRNKNCMIVLCKDGIPEDRKEENEDYKADRSHDLEYNIWQDVDIIEDMAFRIHDVYFAHNPKLEADDVLYSLAKKIEKNTENTYPYIFSSDNDLLQAMSDRIKIARKINKRDGLKVIDEEYLNSNKSMIRNFRYCPTEKLPVYRAIIGDSSDNLDGLYRFPRKLATMIAKKCNTIEDVKKVEFEDLDEEERKPSYEKHLQRCKDEFELLKSNYKIMKLEEDIEFDIWRDDREETKQRADRLARKLKMSKFREFIVASGYNHEIGI